MDKKERLLARIILTLACSAFGYVILYYQTNFFTCLAIFLITIGNNIDERMKTDKTFEK